jgi:uncharacterized DUF497 family protein
VRQTHEETLPAGRGEDMHKNMYTVISGSFEWDEDKNLLNTAKHAVSFEEAKYCFSDPRRLIASDDAHSTMTERRFICFGRIERGIVTVRYTHRGERIRILGAGFWRKGRKAYDAENG